jgi:hypothetical protein
MSQVSTQAYSKSEMKSQYQEIIKAYKTNNKSMQKKFSSTIQRTLAQMDN